MTPRPTIVSRVVPLLWVCLGLGAAGCLTPVRDLEDQPPSHEPRVQVTLNGAAITPIDRDGIPTVHINFDTVRIDQRSESQVLTVHFARFADFTLARRAELEVEEPGDAFYHPEGDVIEIPDVSDTPVTADQARETDSAGTYTISYAFAPKVAGEFETAVLDLTSEDPTLPELRVILTGEGADPIEVMPLPLLPVVLDDFNAGFNADDELVIGWYPSAEGGREPTHYNVYVAGLRSNCVEEWRLVQVETEMTTRIPGLISTLEYVVMVRAADGLEESVDSNYYYWHPLQPVLSDISPLDQPDFMGICTEPPPDCGLHNPTLAMDVNNDGAVSAIDALIIINMINDNDEPPAGTFPDVSGDCEVTEEDAALVIRALGA